MVERSPLFTLRNVPPWPFLSANQQPVFVPQCNIRLQKAPSATRQPAGIARDTGPPSATPNCKTVQSRASKHARVARCQGHAAVPCPKAPSAFRRMARITCRRCRCPLPYRLLLCPPQPLPYGSWRTVPVWAGWPAGGRRADAAGLATGTPLPDRPGTATGTARRPPSATMRVVADVPFPAWVARPSWTRGAQPMPGWSAAGEGNACGTT
jgi:hypothetical protein